jgi:hypothetical protein
MSNFLASTAAADAVADEPERGPRLKGEAL